MNRTFLFLVAFWVTFGLRAQAVEKENLTKVRQTYWDFNKTRLQSSGKCYKDIMGETSEKHGKWTFYDRHGEVEEVRYYYRDMLHGEAVLYYPNGKKRQQGFFWLDRQDSIYNEWYESGKLKTEGNYTLNEPVGKWKHYYRDGRLKLVEETRGEDN